MTGPISLGLADVWQWLKGLVHGDTSVNGAAVVIEQIRIPRAVLAAAVGATLAMCGAVCQGLFRNPLADPALIGLSAGATLGANLVIVFGAGALLPLAGLSLVSVGAFIGASIAAWLVYRLASDRHGTSVVTMLLVGIAISALAAACGTLLEYVADNDMLRRISLWRMGGLEGATPQSVYLASAVCLLLLIVLPRFARALNALLLGESEARHLGVDTEQLKRRLITLVALGVGCSVALTGTIAFVGLVVPHIVRLLTGPDHRYLLMNSALAGALLLMLADTGAKLIAAPAELPVGVLTAMIGVPFFLSLLHNRYRYGI
jgi:iron complex transport system permease protein